MKLTERIKEKGALGYILMWLLGIPIPILLVIFLPPRLHLAAAGQTR